MVPIYPQDRFIKTLIMTGMNISISLFCGLYLHTDAPKLVKAWSITTLH